MSSVPATDAKAPKARLHIDHLEERAVPAVTADFFQVGGFLQVQGDAGNNDLFVQADAAGNLQVLADGEQVDINVISVPGFGDPAAPTTANTNNIQISGNLGNDRLSVDASVGTINLTLDGGAGNDVLDLFNGSFGAAYQGNSVMIGGAGNDQLISGRGNDAMFGGDGNDLLRWDPGTINDFMEGGRGRDTVQVIGNDTFLSDDPSPDTFQLSANGERVRFDRLNLIPFTLDIGTVENIVLQPGDGDDTVLIKDLTGVKSLRTVTVEGGQGNDVIDASEQANARIRLRLDGGEGDDTITGGAGRDVIRGGDGNDTLDGGDGRDQVRGDAGDDTIDGGDDNQQDRLIGGAGADTYVVHAAQKADAFRGFNPATGDEIEEVL